MDTERRKSLRNKLIVACFGSSFVGTIGVLWFFLAAFNLTMTHFKQTIFPAILIFSIDAFGQFLTNEWLLKNFFKWIEDSEFRKKASNTKAALVEILWFPFRGSFISLCFWLFTAFFIGGYLYITNSDYSPRQLTTMIVATIGGGFISLSFQYSFYKRIFRKNCIDLMSADTEFLRKQGTTLMNARTKWLAGMLILLSVGLVYLYFMGNNRAAEAIMRRMSNLTAKVGRQAIVMISNGESEEAINTYLVESWERLDQQVFLFDKTGKIVYGQAPKELDEATIKKILKEYDNIIARSIRTNEYFSRNIPGSSDEFFWVRMDENLSVGSVFYRGVANGVLGGFNISVALLAAFFLFIATFVAYFAASDIADPMAVMLDLAEKISRGDLTENVNLISEDEIGRLAAGLQVMIEELRGMMGRVNLAAEQVDRAAYDIMESQTQVTDGAGRQTSAIEETSALAGDLNGLVNQITENIEVMAESAKESAKSIIDIEGLSHELSENIGELSGAVETTTSAIYEMNASVKEINEGAEVLTKVAEDTASSTMQMNQAIKEVEDNARETLTISETVNSDAQKGVASVQSTINGIGKIEESVREATEVISNLGRQAEEIGQIVSVITDIADQTNLLALNAAIIAAQAGERGRSFAVVADEIKKLSERTTHSTKEIRELIASVQGETLRAVSVMDAESKSVEEGVNLAFQAGQALEKIQKSAKKGAEMAQQISSATTEQAMTSKRVTESIAAIADRVTQISSAIKEQSRGADQISRASGEMREIAPMVRMKAQKQSEGGKQITSAMENIKDMVNYVLKSQQKQQEHSERIMIAMNQIKNILKANTETVARLSVTVNVLSRQSDNLKTEVSRFKLPS